MLLFQTGNLRKNAEKPGRRAPERVPLPGFLSINWHVVFKTKAHRRAVPGRGSQRMLHALGRRSHPADHGPSFASLYSPFCRYATSSPDRGKSLLAGGGQLSCNSRTGQIKNAPSECSAAVTTVDVPSRWDPRANQSPTGALVAVLRTAALFDSRTGQIKNALAHCAKAFL